MTVVIDSGTDTGFHTAVGDPNCAFGAVGEGTWSAQYGNLTAGPNDISQLQLTDEPDSSDKSGKARIVSVYLVVGPVFAGRSYTLSLDRFGDRSDIYELSDNGTTALIHVNSKTVESPLGPGGVGIDVTLNCPTVTR